ncbi:hypothetical protein LINPERHAP2_LOCUS22978, partial [Linum perenne]
LLSPCCSRLPSSSLSFFNFFLSTFPYLLPSSSLPSHTKSRTKIASLPYPAAAATSRPPPLHLVRRWSLSPAAIDGPSRAAMPPPLFALAAPSSVLRRRRPLAPPLHRRPPPSKADSGSPCVRRRRRRQVPPSPPSKSSPASLLLVPERQKGFDEG